MYAGERAEADMGGVFINYRTVDNPLGAASIYQGLAGKFGSHQVFRDIVSLDAGTHYPSSIRSALENADVLLAVIGPQWLSLKDPETRERLIDRPQDWVRREIAIAFQLEIVVLPVLLKDTPENAYLPTPDELPKDIRELATIQALEISQRRLDADLAHLARTLGRLRPALVGATPPGPETGERFRIERDFVDTLLRSPMLREDSSRELIVTDIGRLLGAELSLHRRTTAKTSIIELVRVCVGLPNGLDLLIDQLRFVDPLAPELPRLRQLREEWHAAGDVR
jgi:hypothetical protein